jgi:hypothetical protein
MSITCSSFLGDRVDLSLSVGLSDEISIFGKKMTIIVTITRYSLTRCA